jgi:predicted dithiol-disulfide oxidoreductase (DUF899 family)
LESITSNRPVPQVTDRATWQARIDELRVKEKAHTRAGDALAAERRRLPMVEVDPTTKLIGADGPVPLIDIFDGRSQLIACFQMWHTGRPARGAVRGLHLLHHPLQRAVLSELAGPELLRLHYAT